ncbi:DEKNAAC101391, partial [Brettanomyces naardenensis]
MERMSSLEKEVEEKRRQYERSPKKKKVPPIVPKKKAILGEVVKPVNDVEDKNEVICLVQPKAREDDLRSPKIERESGADQLARLVDSVNYGAKYEVPNRNPHEPKPIKYEDVMKVKVWDSRSETTNSKVKEKPSTEKSPVPVNRSKPIIITPRSHTNPNAKVLTSYHRESAAPSLSKNPPRKPLRSEPYPETVEVRAAKIKMKPTVAPKPKPASSPEFLSKFKSLQPAPVLAKPEEKIPEALVRRNHLNRPKVGPKPIIGVPEAVSRRNNLNKPKDVPRPEQRIPEALERLQTLRKQGVRKTGSDREHSPAKEKTSYQNMGPIALPGMVRTSLSLPV